jgi:hypothetical protein
MGSGTGRRAPRRSPPRLLLEVDAGERLPVRVADDVAGVRLLGGPGRREAALGHGPLVNRKSVIIPKLLLNMINAGSRLCA